MKLVAAQAVLFGSTCGSHIPHHFQFHRNLSLVAEDAHNRSLPFTSYQTALFLNKSLSLPFYIKKNNVNQT